jgi:hypothetical protein
MVDCGRWIVRSLSCWLEQAASFNPARWRRSSQACAGSSWQADCGSGAQCIIVRLLYGVLYLYGGPPYRVTTPSPGWARGMVQYSGSKCGWCCTVLMYGVLRLYGGTAYSVLVPVHRSSKIKSPQGTVRLTHYWTTSAVIVAFGLLSVEVFMKKTHHHLIRSRLNCRQQLWSSAWRWLQHENKRPRPSCGRKDMKSGVISNPIVSDCTRGVRLGV